jgi:hypothetical protein
MWAPQIDLPLRPSSALSPVLFVDTGGVPGRRPLFGAGAGLSVLGGCVRPNVAYGIRPGLGWRFDLLFGAPR